MTLIEHLEELRARIFKMVIAVAVTSIASWFFYDRILSFLIEPITRLPSASQFVTRGKLVFFSPQEAFFVRIKVVSVTGIALALPVILWQAWRFVVPGLHKHERRYAIPFVLVSSALFAAGIAVAFAMLPAALRVLTAFGGSELVIVPRASEYLSFLLLLIFAFGATFELPVIVLALTLAGVVSTAVLRKGRRWAYVIILVVAAVVTPTPDPINMCLLAAPLLLLYEGTILVARLLKR